MFCEHFYFQKDNRKSCVGVWMLVYDFLREDWKIRFCTQISWKDRKNEKFSQIDLRPQIESENQFVSNSSRYILANLIVSNSEKCEPNKLYWNDTVWKDAGNKFQVIYKFEKKYTAWFGQEPFTQIMYWLFCLYG